MSQDGGTPHGTPWPLEVWIPGAIENPNNGALGGLGRRGPTGRRWNRRARARKFWRTTVQLECARALWRRRVDPTVPKHVTFLARVWNLFDDDGLRAALKGHRDGLRDAGIIDDDSPRHPHVFEYFQAIDRARRGVTLMIKLREA
jgi:hypothetical protein